MRYFDSTLVSPGDKTKSMQIKVGNQDEIIDCEIEQFRTRTKVRRSIARQR